MSFAARLLCVLALGALALAPAASQAEDGDQGSDRGASAGPVAVGTIGPDSAQVTGTARLGSSSAGYWFEYGPTTALGQATPAAVLSWRDANRDGDAVVSRTLVGLTPSTTYHVRLVIDDGSDGGANRSTLASFTTAPPPPPGAAPSSDPANPDATSPTPGERPESAPDPSIGPALGASVVTVADRGTVRVRLPGSKRFVDLPREASVPVGTVVDARRGTIALTTALPGGGVQRGSFGGARFQVSQAANGNGRTDLHLRGGGFAACRAPHRARALASVAVKKRRKPVRRLWGKDHGGRFRTHGRDSVTTVRGTEWSVADRCNGTVTRVTEGAVDVRVRRTGRVVRLEAGERFVARHRR